MGSEPSRFLRMIRIVSLLLIFLLAGFYVSTYIRLGQQDAPAIVENSPSRVNAADRIPEFSLSDLRGETRSITEWSGRPLIVNFWATWCAPCRREMPLLQTLHEERRDDALEVIGIAIDRIDKVDSFISESGITYPILAGQQDAMDIAEQFGADFVALPFTVFTAGDGQILWLHLGELHRDQLRTILGVSDQVARGELAAAAARALIESRLEASSG
jgi:thiol-disulfide isomerase/thioredoxin